jgi:hypothetical protein
MGRESIGDARQHHALYLCSNNTDLDIPQNHEPTLPYPPGVAPSDYSVCQFPNRKNLRDMIQNVYQSPCKVPFFSCPILMKLEFSQQIFQQILKYQIS